MKFFAAIYRARLSRPIAALLSLVLLLLTSGCKTTEDRRNQVKMYLEAAHELWGFDGAVMVTWRGRDVFSGGYGFANQAFGEPNTTETRFFIGSITKQFTAAAILLLQQDRLLNVGDPIFRYLPDYPRDVAEKVTISNLLTHTSGIPNYTDNISVLLRRTEYMSPADLIGLFAHDPLEFEPGTKFHYSNSNYILLGEIIERVSGQSYEAFLDKRIFKPCGMTNTGYARREAGIPERADGYTLEDKETPANALPLNFSILHSAGALYSTAEDLHRWDSMLYTDKILTESSKRLMLTPYIDGYGYGWRIDTLYGRTHTYHGGFLDGFNTIIDRWPDDRIAIIILSNEDEAPVEKMARGVAAILHGEPYTMPVRKTAIQIDPSLYGEYNGVYRVNQDVYRFVNTEHDTLFTHLRGQRRQTLFPQAPDTFFFASDNTRIMVFNRDDSGSVAGTAIIDDNRVEYSRKLGGAMPVPDQERTEIRLPAETIQRYEGVYEIESEFGRSDNGFRLIVKAARDHLLVSVTGNEAVALFPGSETDFFLKDGDFYLSFILSNDEVIGCRVMMGGVTVHGIKIH